MNRLAFEEACAIFKRGLVSRAAPHRYYEELYDHKRYYEVSVWWGAGEAEVGLVFAMDSSCWKGEIDWERIEEILQKKQAAITFQMGSGEYVWWLNDLSETKRGKFYP